MRNQKSSGMNQPRHFSKANRVLSRACTATLLLSLMIPSGAAFADGLIKFDVVNAKTGKALSGAVIRIEPAASEIDELQFKASDKGVVSTGDLVSGERVFTVTAIVEGMVYRPFKGKVTVVDNDTVTVRVAMVEQGFKTFEVNDKVVRINLDDPSSRTYRDKALLHGTALGAGNGQSLNKVLRSVSGFTSDSLGGLISRGEQNPAQFYVDGFQLPARVVGSNGQWVDLAFIETLTARTGGNAAAHGGSSSAIIDLGLTPAISPYGSPVRAAETNVRTSNGEFGTSENLITISKQRPRLNNARTDIGYVIGVSNRTTSNASLSPQNGGAAPNGGGSSNNAFGKVEVRLNPSTEVSSTFSLGSAITGIGNRTGLGAKFNGTGFGYGGVLDTFAGGTSQADLGLDVSQRDNSELFITQIRKQQRGGRSATFTVGVSKQTQSTTNNTVPVLQGSLPAESSVEFLPSVYQNYRSTGVQADFVSPSGSRTTRYGIALQSMGGGESMYLNPQSAAAITALGNMGGQLAARFGPDSTGHIPVIYASRKSDYAAAYYQVGKTTGSLRWNAGIRGESFDQTNFFARETPNFDPNSSDVYGNPIQRGARTSAKVSPRFNALYILPKDGTFKLLGLRLFGYGLSQPGALRFSYNQLFTPALGQGSMAIGQTSLDPLAYPTKPQTTDQFDFSIERQFGSQTLKLGSYMKVNNDAVGYSQIVPGAQAVGFTTTSLGKVRADGVELTYTLNPRNEVNPGNVAALSGTTGFVTVSNQKVRIDNATTGAYSPEFDQRTSVVAGLSQGLGGGSRLGLSYAYGSGLTASQFQGGNRASLNEANARLQFGHKLFGVVSIDASVENLFNANSLVSYGSTFAGTRFQQGRRALLTLSAKY